MSTLARILAVAIALLGSTACLKPNPLAQVELAGDSETDFSSEAEAEAEADSDSPLPDVLASSDSSDSGPACPAPPELELVCSACLVDHCCTSLAPCGDDPVCVCLADCLFAGKSENNCRMLCGEKPADVVPLAPLLSCASQDCAACFVG